MKLVISAPSGFNTREILLPLKERLDADPEITEVHVITPAAPYHRELFPTFGSLFHWHANPPTLDSHVALLKNIAPSVILTPTIGLDTRDIFIIRAGKQLNIPTVTFVASWDNVFKMERLKAKGFSGAEKGRELDFEFPDYIAVWNQMNLEHIASSFNQEIAHDRITITGPPRFDYFNHTDRIPTKSQLLEFLGWPKVDSESPLLHFATTELYPFEYIIQAIHKASQQGELPVNALLYASVHPGGDMSRHQHYAKYGVHVKYSFGRRDQSHLPEFAYLPTEKEIYWLIALWQHTSVLVNQSSTVAIESMAADRPVINVKYGRPLDWIGWRRSMVYRDFTQHYRYITEANGTSIVQNPHQLIGEINNYLRDPSLKHAERQQTLKKMITFTDGGNSQRLLDYIKKCAV